MSPCCQPCPMHGWGCPGAVPQALLPQCEVHSQPSPGHHSSQGSCPKTKEVSVLHPSGWMKLWEDGEGGAQPLQCTARPNTPSMLTSSLPKAFFVKQLSPPQSVRHGKRDCRIHMDRKFCKVMSFDPLQTSWEVKRCLYLGLATRHGEVSLARKQGLGKNIKVDE